MQISDSTSSKKSKKKAPKKGMNHSSRDEGSASLPKKKGKIQPLKKSKPLPQSPTTSGGCEESCQYSTDSSPAPERSVSPPRKRDEKTRSSTSDPRGKKNEPQPSVAKARKGTTHSPQPSQKRAREEVEVPHIEARRAYETSPHDKTWKYVYENLFGNDRLIHVWHTCGKSSCTIKDISTGSNVFSIVVCRDEFSTEELDFIFSYALTQEYS